MELGTTLRQTVEQRLLLLPKMLQAIEILQLSTRDLLGMIEQELSENETLELAPDRSEPEPEAPAEEERRDGDYAYDDVPRRSRDEEDRDPMKRLPAHNLSLHGHLLSQLVMLDLPAPVREIVSFLIGSLDQNGHLLLDEEEMATFFPEDGPVAESLAVLRSLDPPGVGAAGPLESMLAQLDPRDPDASYLETIVCHHLDDLAKNRLPGVAKALSISLDELKLLLGKLRKLDPCPGRAFQVDEPVALDPDVVVRREDGEWQVYVDDARVPTLMISEDYAQLAVDRSAPRRVRSYLKRKLGSARELLAAIEQRRETLGRVARAILERQRAFLERGLTALEPLKMQEVADAVGVHLSTVSRATAEKFVQTDFGVFPLRRLFDGGKAVGSNADGEGGASRASVKESVRRVVAAEDGSHPLSDEDIVHELERQGLRIARRTVAKYRKELGIPSSWRRREFLELLELPGAREAHRPVKFSPVVPAPAPWSNSADEARVRERERERERERPELGFSSRIGPLATTSLALSPAPRLTASMRTLRLWISYDGTAYAGWQRQSNGEAVQEVVERAVSLITGETVTVHGAGRTDGGVHALAQSAHVKVSSGPPTEAFHKALNTVLPPDIRVGGAREMPSSFHARFSARAKRYLYRIQTDPVAPPIGRRYFHWFSGGPLDLVAMRRAKRHLIGRHDFVALATNPGHGRQRPTIRTIQSLHLRGSERRVDLIVQGDGFLYNMVRTLAGTLLEVGRGRREPAWVADVIASCDRKTAGPTLPPQGLFLVRVLYPPEFGPDRPPGEIRGQTRR